MFKNIIIITGHGEYAKGIVSALKVVSGLDDSVFAVDFMEEDNEQTLEKKYQCIIDNNKNKGILFACDLLGGTPYKVAAKLTFTNNSIRVVTGANLGGIIDTKIKKGVLSLDELSENLIKSTNKNILLFKTNNNVDKKDGI